MFSVHTTPEEFKNAKNHRIFWICVCGKLGQGNHMIIATTSLFEERFRQAPYS